ncbi:MAG: hydantoinase B/oxoprolinase family protein [Chloroflexi bacterium]|nr:hydantoinase B/oxoprolinase family protein [Chloroflexota bacterium]
MRAKQDAIALEVFLNALATLCEEVGISLMRSAFSTNIKERKDFSCALFSRDLDLVARAEHLPAHLGALPRIVRNAVGAIEEKMLDDGDVLLFNAPFLGGTHLPDLTTIAPIYAQGELLAYFAILAHHVDVGGSTPGSLSPLAREIYQEGIVIPPIKLVEKGKLNSAILSLILANVRSAPERRWDIMAQMGALALAKEKVLAMAAKHGSVGFLQGLVDIESYARRRMAQQIARLPRGSYAAEDFLEAADAKTLVLIRVKITIGGGGITFDFTGSAPQQDSALNGVASHTLSAVYYVVRAVTDPDIPFTSSSMADVHVVAPPGSVVNAQYPAAVGGGWNVSMRVVDVCLKALAPAMPDAVIAACNGAITEVSFGGIDPYRGAGYTYYESVAGGYGARPTLDGIDGCHAHVTNTRNPSVEDLEMHLPIQILRYELRPGSGGAGRFRGGMGIRRDYRLLGHSATFSVISERQHVRPYGLFGGEDGGPSSFFITTSQGEMIPLDCKFSRIVPPDSVVTICTPGAGGYGDPSTRDPERVQADREDGKV